MSAYNKGAKVGAFVANSGTAIKSAAVSSGKAVKAGAVGTGRAASGFWSGFRAAVKNPSIAKSEVILLPDTPIIERVNVPEIIIVRR